MYAGHMLPACLDGQGKDMMYSAQFPRPAVDSRQSSFLLTNTVLTTFSPDMPATDTLQELDKGTLFVMIT